MPNTPDDDTDEVFVRPFADVLAEHNGGAAAREVSDKLHELIAAVRDTGKKGSVTLKFSLSAMDDYTLVGTFESTSTLPKIAPKNAIYYPTDQGNISREDPNQLTFNSLESVPTPAEKLAAANEAAAAKAAGQ